jgi:hypothetical protein
MWIKLIKGHYKEERYINAKNWIETLQPMFDEIYGYSSKEYYNDFLDCMFLKLLEIHLLIKDDRSGHNLQLKELFNASFKRSFSREYDLPIERTIAELCGQIQFTVVIENGVERFKL